MPENTNALAVVKLEKLSLSTIISNESNRMVAIEMMGTWLARSGMVKCSNSEQGKIIVLACMELGLGLFEFFRTYDVMDDNKIHKKALAALAEFVRAGGKKAWVQSGDDEISGTQEQQDQQAAVLHLEWRDEKLDYRYSMRDGRREGLVRPNSRWTKRPGNMLRARCITNALGMICPEIFAGEFEDDSEPAPLPELNLRGTVTDVQRPVPDTAGAATPSHVTLRETVTTSEKLAPATGGTLSRVIDIPATVAGPAPAAQAAPEPMTTPTITDSPVPASGGDASQQAASAPASISPAIGVPLELAQQLMALINAEPPGFVGHAIAWLRGTHANFKDSPWLADSESFENLTEIRMKRICNQWAGWRLKVMEFAGAK